MSRRFRVYGTQMASVSQVVELSDEYLAHIAEVVGVNVDALNPSDVYDYAVERAAEGVAEDGVPGICAQCAGWGQKWSRDVDDEITWNIEDDGDITEVTD